MQHDQADLGRIYTAQLTFHGAVGAGGGPMAKLAAGLLRERPGGETQPRAPRMKMSGDEPSIGCGYC